jgi:hypothetical protein
MKVVENIIEEKNTKYNENIKDEVKWKGNNEEKGKSSSSYLESENFKVN